MESNSSAGDSSFERTLCVHLVVEDQSVRSRQRRPFEQFRCPRGTVFAVSAKLLRWRYVAEGLTAPAWVASGPLWYWDHTNQSKDCSNPTTRVIKLTSVRVSGTHPWPIPEIARPLRASLGR